jgi:PAS domain S-box-containing protein
VKPLTDVPDPPAALQRRLARERKARLQAEAIAEEATRKLYGEVQQTLADLRASRAELASILEAVAEGICGVDLTGNVTFLNPAGARLLRVDAVACIGTPEHALIHPRVEDGTDYKLADCPIHKTLQHGISRLVENDVMWRGDGTWFIADYACAPILQDGHVASVVIAFRDVTEQREREDLIRKYVADLERKE